MNVRITWLGHATFLLSTPAGKTLLVDPWLAGNPRCPAAFHQTASDAILITHGHPDHTGDAVAAAGRCSGPVVAIYELAVWLQSQGVPESKVLGMNKGGTTALPGLDVTLTMTDARHSSAVFGPNGTITYLGEPAGYVLGFANGVKLYLAGDTALFGDMALIRELEQPDTAILPIGDYFTMGPKAAAHACALLGVKRVIPCHYGTFPVLTGTPQALRAELKARQVATEVLELEPGASTRLD
jgi:L-ascorbate metabolism protein UlaG (beta-lactamase superfamily)